MTKIRVRVEDEPKIQPNATADKAVQCDEENGPLVRLYHEEKHQPLQNTGAKAGSDLDDDEDLKAAKKHFRDTVVAEKARRHHLGLPKQAYLFEARPDDEDRKAARARIRNTIAARKARTRHSEMLKQALLVEMENAVESRVDEPKFLRLTPDVTHENKSEQKSSTKDNSEFGDVSDHSAANGDVESEATLKGKDECSNDSNNSSPSRQISWGYVEDERHNSHYARIKDSLTSFVTASHQTGTLPTAKKPSTPNPQRHLVVDKIKEALVKKVAETASVGEKKDDNDKNHPQQVDAEREKAHLEGYRNWQEENIGVRHDVEGNEYSQEEAECFDNLQVALDLDDCENLFTQGPGNTVSIHNKFYDIANELFFRHLFPVLGIYESISDGIKNCTMSKWLVYKVQKVVMSANRELAYDTSAAEPDFVSSAETHLEYHLKHLTLEICRHRRIENFQSDLAYFEKVKGRQTEMYKDGEGLLLRIFRCLYDEELPQALQASLRPADNARLIGAKWPVWTDKPLHQYGNLKDFLGVDDEEVLKPIGHFIAGLPKTAEAFRFLYAWYKDHEPRPAEGRDSLAMLKKVWYGGRTSHSVISREGRLDRSDHSLKAIWSQLSTGEKEAVKTLCRVEEERSLDEGW